MSASLWAPLAAEVRSSIYSPGGPGGPLGEICALAAFGLYTPFQSIIQDNFTGTNGVLLTAHTAEEGVVDPWTSSEEGSLELLDGSAVSGISGELLGNISPALTWITESLETLAISTVFGAFSQEDFTATVALVSVAGAMALEFKSISGVVTLTGSIGTQQLSPITWEYCTWCECALICTMNEEGDAATLEISAGETTDSAAVVSPFNFGGAGNIVITAENIEANGVRCAVVDLSFHELP